MNSRVYFEIPVKIVLGWMMNEPLGRECCENSRCQSIVTVNRISVM